VGGWDRQWGRGWVWIGGWGVGEGLWGFGGLKVQTINVSSVPVGLLGVGVSGG
jgi:hypothetical protein